MNALTAALKEELNVEMVSVFGLQIPESVVVSWGIICLLYTSDAADEEDSVVLGGRGMR